MLTIKSAVYVFDGLNSTKKFGSFFSGGISSLCTVLQRKNLRRYTEIWFFPFKTNEKKKKQQPAHMHTKQEQLKKKEYWK